MSNTQSMDMMYNAYQTTIPLSIWRLSWLEITVKVSVCTIHDDCEYKLILVFVFKICVDQPDDMVVLSRVETFYFLHHGTLLCHACCLACNSHYGFSNAFEAHKLTRSASDFLHHAVDCVVIARGLL
jgi:hypothetical protein